MWGSEIVREGTGRCEIYQYLKEFEQIPVLYEWLK